MIEQHNINGNEVWLKIEPYHVERSNPNIIPTEYFTASYFLQPPAADSNNGEMIKEEGEAKLFESPVAALSFVQKKLEGML